MSDAALDLDAPLTVLLDIRSPGAYLALHPAAALGDELGIKIDWLPLRTPPLRAPSEPSPDDDRSVLHRRHRARALAREIEVYGEAQGLVLRAPYRDPDPSAFELGWLWLRARERHRVPDLLREAFRAYWALELDPSSVPAVATAIESVGGDAAGFTAWCATAGPALASRVDSELRARGLSGVPGHLVDGEFFVGRQHGPMIRWILEGRQDPGPI